MQARGAGSTVVHRMAAVTTPRLRFWQIPRRDGCRQRNREKCFSAGNAVFNVSLASHTYAGPKVGSVLPYCFLAGHMRSFFALSSRTCRLEPCSVVSYWEPRGQRRYLRQHGPLVGSSFVTSSAAGGGIMGTINSANRSFPMKNASGCSSLTDGRLEYSTALKDESDVVELASEVVPSRVKGPLSRFSVCLLHGLLGNRRNMRTLGSFLASPRVLAWDLRNHGESEWRDTMSIDELARDVLYNLHERASLFRFQHSAGSLPSLRDNLPSSKSVGTPIEPPLEVVLVGHSLGGLIAMRAAMLGASEINRSHYSAPQPAVRIAGIVVLDIAPIDYTTDAEQERFREHHGQTGIPGTEDLVRLLHDLPMHLFENRKQLEKTLLTSTDPSLPPHVISWLMTGVVEGTAHDSSKRSKIPTGTEAARQSCRSRPMKKNVIPGSTPPGQGGTHVLGWRMNIGAIHRMLASKRLRWHFTDSPVFVKTEDPSQCRGGRAFQNQPREFGRDLRESPGDRTISVCHKSSNDRAGTQTILGFQPHVDCAAYRGPALFLRGSESPYIDMEKHWCQTLSVFPNAKCKVVRGAGHWLHADKPQLTADYINEFLTSI